jgi:SOS-response transcriptional repressor LexA
MNMTKVGGNIRALRKMRKLSQAALAALCGWENASRISNYEKTPREPTLEDIEVLAKALQTLPGILAFEDCTQKSFLPHFTGLPILEWEQAVNWPNNKDEILASTKTKFLHANPAGTNRNCYALQVKDDAMVGSNQKQSFPKGSYIIINPDKKYKEDDFVIAKKENGKLIFRQYVTYSGDEFLTMFKTGITEPSIRINNSHVKISGVVIAHLDLLI